MPEARRPLVALTGGTGFLGRHLLDRLSAAGWPVRALVRRTAPEGANIEIVRGALDDEAALERLVRNADLVIHAAGATKAPRRADFVRVNADGAGRLAQAVARFAPRAHVLLVSSLAAREPALSAYAASKRLGEERTAALVAPERLLILRPPALYGPGDRQTLALFRAARWPLVPAAGSGRERIAVLHGADAACIAIELLERRATGRFELADERPGGYAMRELLTEAARAQGREPRLVTIPDAMLQALGAAGSLTAWLTGRPALLSSDKLREMRHEDWAVDPAHLPPATSVGVRSLKQGFADAVAWYRQAKWL